MKLSVSSYSFNQYIKAGKLTQLECVAKAKELGFEVTSLKRIRIEKITIDGLKIGQYRELTDMEKEKLYETVGLK